MRSIAAIVSEAKDGKVPSHEECFWVMLALSGMLHFSRRELGDIAECIGDDKRLLFNVKLRLKDYETTFGKGHKWLNMDPQKWLGDSGNPFHPDTKAFHDMAQKILDNAIKRLEK